VPDATTDLAVILVHQLRRVGEPIDVVLQVKDGVAIDRARGRVSA